MCYLFRSLVLSLFVALCISAGRSFFLYVVMLFFISALGHVCLSFGCVLFSSFVLYVFISLFLDVDFLQLSLSLSLYVCVMFFKSSCIPLFIKLFL